MDNKNLSALLAKINIIESRGPHNKRVAGFCIDSRHYTKGQIYFAQKGIHSDGHRYIDEVIHKGCEVVVHSDPLDHYVENITYIRVPDARKALSPAASAFYGDPTSELKVIGVTGTDGKSSTVSYVYQLLDLLKLKSGFISTVEYLTGSEVKKNPFRMSTPEAFEIHRMLREMLDNGKEYAVIESTSHGLAAAYSRLADIQYDAGVLTNLTHEHLEFHGSIEQYAKDKANLFRQLKSTETSRGIIRSEEPYSEIFLPAFIGPWTTYSFTDPEADAYGRITDETAEGIHFVLRYKNQQYECFIPLHGTFNVNNVIAAALAVESAAGIPFDQIIEKVAELKAVKGRMQSISLGQPFSVIIDYAHSPGSFEKLLPEIRSRTKGRLIILFGSAGERDTAKRPIQGSIAAEYADIVILSDEDPRNEDSLSICRDIASGSKKLRENENLFIIPDRTKGINTALSMATKEDTVLFLGKGHESSIIYSSGPLPWDETAAVIKGLQTLGYDGR